MPFYDFGTSWGIYDCDTSKGLSMNVTLPWPLYDCETSLDIYDYETSWCLYMIVKLPGTSMIEKLPGATFLSLSKWLWYFGDCLYDCGTFWGLLMIVTFYRASFMIVTLHKASLWLWHFLGLLNDYATSWDLLMIVTLHRASLWLWHFLRGLYVVWHFLGFLYNCSRKSEFCLSQLNLIYSMFKKLIIIEEWLYNWYDTMQGNLILLIKNSDIHFRFYGH